MFYIFSFDERDYLENVWRGRCQEDPIKFITQLTNSQLEQLILWAVAEVTAGQVTFLEGLIKFLKKRRRYHRQQWFRSCFR